MENLSLKEISKKMLHELLKDYEEEQYTGAATWGMPGVVYANVAGLAKDKRALLLDNEEGKEIRNKLDRALRSMLSKGYIETAHSDQREKYEKGELFIHDLYIRMSPKGYEYARKLEWNIFRRRLYDAKTYIYTLIIVIIGSLIVYYLTRFLTP